MNALLSVVLGSLVLSAGYAWAGTTAVIPEPTSLALIAAGAGAVAWAKFRKRR